MLDKIFAEALKRLNDMPKEDFVKFLNDYLAGLALDGESLYVPNKYGITAKDIKAKNVVLATDGARAIEGGFMLAQKGIEQNHTFEALIGYYRDELESEVLKILYAE
jgi:V/A-type H+-transporting ATPase subunit E